MLAVNATLFPLARSYSSLVVYVVVFGLFDGCLAVMFGMGTLHIVGEKLVGRAFGNLCCAAAVGNLLGPPVAGWYILSNVRPTVSDCLMCCHGVFCAEQGNLAP